MLPLAHTASFDDLGLPPLSMRHGKPAAKSGWLVRGRLPGRRKFFVLRGAVLTQTDAPPDDISGALVRRSSFLPRPTYEAAPVAERFCIFNTAVEPREAKLSILLPRIKLYLVAPDKNSYLGWLEAITSASERRLDDYYILVESVILGTGSFGRVCKGYDLETRDTVAIKVVEKDKCSQRELKQAESEAAIVMTVGHPNVVQTHDIFETDKALYIVMELMHDSVEGILTDMRPRNGFFTEAEAREIMKSIANALTALHGLGIVHRDIKPDNILVKSKSSPYFPKLCDFGFGAFVGVDQEADTSLKGTIGTSVYLAPEVVLNKTYGRPVDMWALGVNIYELISGVTPFDAPTVGEVVRSIRDSPVQFNQPVWDDISEECKSLILLLLEKDPMARLTAPMVLSSPWLREADPSDSPASSIPDDYAMPETKMAPSSVGLVPSIHASEAITRLMEPGSMPIVPAVFPDDQFEERPAPVPELSEHSSDEEVDRFSGERNSRASSCSSSDDVEVRPIVPADDSIDSSELEEERQNLRSWLKGRRTGFEKPRESVTESRLEHSREKRLSLRGSFMRTSLVSDDTQALRRSVEDLRDEQTGKGRRRRAFFNRRVSSPTQEKSQSGQHSEVGARESTFRRFGEKPLRSNSLFSLDGGDHEGSFRSSTRSSKAGRSLERSGSGITRTASLERSSLGSRHPDALPTSISRIAAKHARTNASSKEYGSPPDHRSSVEQKESVSLSTRQSIITKIARQTAKSGSVMFGGNTESESEGLDVEELGGRSDSITGGTIPATRGEKFGRTRSSTSVFPFR